MRFDNNKYSVASRVVGRPVEIQAYADRIVIRQEGARPCEDNRMARERGREYADEMMELSYRRHRFPPVVIQHAVWLYLRFTLSFRDVEDLLADQESSADPMGYRFLPARNRKFESISLQRRVLANLTRSIRSPKILPSGFGSRVGRTG